MGYYDRAAVDQIGAKTKRKVRIISEDDEQAKYRLLIANAESEAEFDASIVKLATLYGWKTYHTYDSRKSAEGWPDRVFTRRPEFFGAELKRENGVLSAAQEAWIEELRACGWEVHVWRPSMWSTIVARLARREGQ